MFDHVKKWSADTSHSIESRRGSYAALIITGIYIVSTVIDCSFKLDYFTDRIQWDDAEGDAGGEVDAEHHNINMVKIFVPPA